ncbi:ABC transporter ATP-binding protein [Halosimplex pelagicum]|uniref:Molybdate/tungstate import ATP-binding protein WtpC n=1 Tax=Halosimplex pelagicum TaxID=869886 RepID=A0A7D5P5Z5_9EURY|nr:ABC transporter ATP-binding protein [Halosimplex pelagicum]QLH81723.1 ABC transporter ATP-binding protein [Halosimplex pelagicum]
MDTETRLTVRDLEKGFGSEFRLSGVDVTVQPDEIVALLGPSGCGKTTVLRCVAGVETPDGGEIAVDGEPVFDGTTSLPPERRDLGMVYQNYAIWPHKTVSENVVFPLEHATDVPSDEYDERVVEVLELMEIADLAESPATDLSGGQQQRTALARAIVHDPGLLLLDEPLSNLDKELRKHMRYELQRLQHELGLSVLYVTHDQQEAFYLADRVLVMNDGAVVERGEPEALYRRPDSPFTRQFVGVRNRFTGTTESDGDGERVVRTGFVDFPLGNVDYVGNGGETDDVECFLRPDDVQIGQFAGEVDGRIELSGTVVAEGIIGDRYELTVRVDDTDATLVVHTENYRQFDRGDGINLQFQPKALQVYEVEA